MSNPVFYYMWGDEEHGFIYRRFWDDANCIWLHPQVYCDFHGEEDLDFMLSEIMRLYGENVEIEKI